MIKVNAASAPGASPAFIYAAARNEWKAGPRSRNVSNLPVFVFAEDIIRAVHRVSEWHQVVKPGISPSGKWEYTGSPDENLEKQFNNTSLRDVRAARATGGWRQHGWHPYY